MLAMSDGIATSQMPFSNLECVSIQLLCEKPWCTMVVLWPLHITFACAVSPSLTVVPLAFWTTLVWKPIPCLMVFLSPKNLQVLFWFVLSGYSIPKHWVTGPKGAPNIWESVRAASSAAGSSHSFYWLGLIDRRNGENGFSRKKGWQQKAEPGPSRHLGTGLQKLFYDTKWPS